MSTKNYNYLVILFFLTIILGSSIPGKSIPSSYIFSKDKLSITYTYDVQNQRTGITNLLQDLRDQGLKLKDIKTEQSTLEKIFVNLVKESNEN